MALKMKQGDSSRTSFSSEWSNCLQRRDAKNQSIVGKLKSPSMMRLHWLVLKVCSRNSNRIASSEWEEEGER